MVCADIYACAELGLQCMETSSYQAPQILNTLSDHSGVDLYSEISQQPYSLIPTAEGIPVQGCAILLATSGCWPHSSGSDRPSAGNCVERSPGNKSIVEHVLGWRNGSGGCHMQQTH